MVLRMLFYGLLIYLGVRFVFNFLIPLIQTTRQVRKQFNDVRNRMQDQVQDPFGPGTHAGSSSTQKTEASKKPAREDYIDFEELRD